MNKIILISLTLVLANCAKTSSKPTTAAAGANSKPLFSFWSSPDGFSGLDLRGLAFGRTQVETRFTSGQTYVCRMVVDVTGDEDSGQVAVVSAVPLNSTAWFSDCQGRTGTYTYLRGGGLLVTMPGRPDPLAYF